MIRFIAQYYGAVICGYFELMRSSFVGSFIFGLIINSKISEVLDLFRKIKGFKSFEILGVDGASSAGYLDPG